MTMRFSTSRIVTKSGDQIAIHNQKGDIVQPLLYVYCIELWGSHDRYPEDDHHQGFFPSNVSFNHGSLHISRRAWMPWGHTKSLVCSTKIKHNFQYILFCFCTLRTNGSNVDTLVNLRLDRCQLDMGIFEVPCWLLIDMRLSHWMSLTNWCNNPFLKQKTLKLWVRSWVISNNPWVYSKPFMVQITNFGPIFFFCFLFSLNVKFEAQNRERKLMYS